jgi:hypothetical protein
MLLKVALVLAGIAILLTSPWWWPSQPSWSGDEPPPFEPGQGAGPLPLRL